jgi:hypothetical protein
VKSAKTNSQIPILSLLARTAVTPEMEIAEEILPEPVVPVNYVLFCLLTFQRKNPE